MEPGTGGEEPRSGRVQGAFMTRSREAELVRHPFEQKVRKKKKTWEWYVECERSDVRGVL
jgi:hypothetical protein